jgi:hypothetical protein
MEPFSSGIKPHKWESAWKAHGRLLFAQANDRPAPDASVTAFKREICGRFGNNRYATLFYGEFDTETQIMR